MRLSVMLRYAIHLIVLGIFNVFFFVLGRTEHPASVWIAYVFINLSYLAIMAMPFFIQKGKDVATFSGVSYGMSTAYFIIELIVGSIIISAAPEDYRWSLLPQLLLLALYLILLFSNRIADEHTAVAVSRHEANVGYIKQACAMVRPLVDEVSDRQTKRKVERAYDALQSSPTKTTAEAVTIEQEILDEISHLQMIAADNNNDEIGQSAERIVQMVNRRNAILRMSN